MVEELIKQVENLNLEVDISGIEPGEELYQIEREDVGKEVEVSQDEREAAEAVLAFHYYAEQEVDGEKTQEALDNISDFRDEEVIEPELEFLYDENYLEDMMRKLEDRNMNKKISEFQEDDATERDDFVDMEEELINYLIGEKYSRESSENSGLF
ncbi:MAG: hypothetical protein ABEK16_04030 [Candidatus Nanohalobium sp.]